LKTFFDRRTTQSALCIAIMTQNSINFNVLLDGEVPIIDILEMFTTSLTGNPIN
jgi:hypothetical protein